MARPLLLLRRCLRPCIPPPSCRIRCRPLSAAAATAAPAEPPAPARTRFAPSPTGFLHLGSLRTALFNYLLAKSTGGQFLLRIEDTDQSRTVPGAEESIYELLRWAGLQWDEGPDVGGPYGPYRQSERSEIHRKHAHKLLENGHAYRCFCGPDRLKALSAVRGRSGLPTDYDRRCASIPASESSARAASGERHVIRLKVPSEYPSFSDVVYGTIPAHSNARSHQQGSFEDPILLKSDGMPTYHLANVVDDHLMRITHVCRATEWMPSTPKHVLLYQCFGWTPPAFVHVGLLQDTEQRKLSKRSGDVNVADYRTHGYLPEALNNFVALMGWSHDTGNDVLSLQDMVRLFRTERLTPGNTIVTFEKLAFLQRHHARARIEARNTSKEAAQKVEEILDVVVGKVQKKHSTELENGAPLDRAYISRVLNVNAQNYLLPDVFTKDCEFFFRQPLDEHPGLAKLQRQVGKYLVKQNLIVDDLVGPLLAQLRELTEGEWDVDSLHKLLELGDKDRAMWAMQMRAFRLALSAGMPGPGVAEIMNVLGRERSLGRLERLEERYLSDLEKYKEK